MIYVIWAGILGLLGAIGVIAFVLRDMALNISLLRSAHNETTNALLDLCKIIGAPGIFCERETGNEMRVCKAIDVSLLDRWIALEEHLGIIIKKIRPKQEKEQIVVEFKKKST